MPNEPVSIYVNRVFAGEGTVISGAITDSVKVLKRQPGLGKINRRVKKAISMLTAKGHTAARFKRDYDAGVATYRCGHCDLLATINLNVAVTDLQISGPAIDSFCSVT